MASYLSGGLLFLAGAAVGSFLNVIISRLGTSESPLAGRSRCTHCHRVLRWYELIPILSFVLQAGRCRSCGGRIPLRYLLIELAAGILFLLVWREVNPGGPLLLGPASVPEAWELSRIGLFLYYATFVSGGLAIAAYDFERLVIPRSLLLPLATVGLAGQIIRVVQAGEPEILALALFSAFAGYLGFAGLWLASRGRAMGLGDAELAATIALYLPPAKFLLAILLAFLIGAAVGGMLVLSRRASWKSRIPFGPFLFGGAVLSFLWADGIMGWYLQLFA